MPTLAVDRASRCGDAAKVLMESGERRVLAIELRGNVPAAFDWQGTRRWVVSSIGRTWEVQGERRYLVMVQGNRVFELACSLDSGSWRVARRPEDFGPRRNPL